MDHDDRSEKIITLARTMLQSNAPPAPQTYSLKTMALVALLSAGMTGTLAILTADQYRPLNRYEKTELQALIYYAAKTGHLDQAAIEQELFGQFAIRSLDELTHAQMLEARIFLQQYIRS